VDPCVHKEVQKVGVLKSDNGQPWGCVPGELAKGEKTTFQLWLGSYNGSGD